MHIDRSTTGRHTHSRDSRVVSLTKWRGCLITIDIVWPCGIVRLAGLIDGQMDNRKERTPIFGRAYGIRTVEKDPTSTSFTTKPRKCLKQDGTSAEAHLPSAQFRLQIEPNSAMEEWKSKDGCLFLWYVFRLKNWRCFCVIHVIHLVCLAMFLFFIEALRFSRDLCAEPPPSFSSITLVCIESRTNKRNMQTYVHSSFVFGGWLHFWLCTSLHSIIIIFDIQTSW